jgi:hypothetical protein
VIIADQGNVMAGRDEAPALSRENIRELIPQSPVVMPPPAQRLILPRAEEISGAADAVLATRPAERVGTPAETTSTKAGVLFEVVPPTAATNRTANDLLPHDFARLQLQMNNITGCEPLPRLDRLRNIIVARVPQTQSAY